MALHNYILDFYSTHQANLPNLSLVIKRLESQGKQQDNMGHFRRVMLHWAHSLMVKPSSLFAVSNLCLVFRASGLPQLRKNIVFDYFYYAAIVETNMRFYFNFLNIIHKGKTPCLIYFFFSSGSKTRGYLDPA